MAYSKTEWKDHVVDATNGAIIQQGTPVSAANLNNMEKGIEEAHSKLEQTGRQVQTLQHGVKVLNGDVNTPVSIQLEGRTLIPMQNTVLDPLKPYVLADKKTKLKWADASVTAGVGKFTAKAERPTLIRVANFEGKKSGSLLENPHWAGSKAVPQLDAPSLFTSEHSDIGYSLAYKLDGKEPLFTSGSTAGSIAQTIFKFNIVDEIERQIGRIPKSILADKIQWCRDNIAKLTGSWYGYGIGPSGNKATINFFNANLNSWLFAASHTNSAFQRLANAGMNGDYIDSNGLMNMIAHAEASDGVTVSTINTDYVELEIELKSTAILMDPRVPLYEVSQTEYDNILVTWNEEEVTQRYPAVEGVKHLQNPYVMTEGENLLPPFSEWALHPNAVVKSPYVLELNAGNSIDVSSIPISVIPGQTYTLQATTGADTNHRLRIKRDSPSGPILLTLIQGSTSGTLTIPTGVTTIYVTVENLLMAGLRTFSEPMLTLGDKAKPFVPRNPSYLFAEAKLGAIGGVKDLLFEQDGKYMVRKAVEKDLVLDGALSWSKSNSISSPTYKLFTSQGFEKPIQDSDKVTKFDGQLLRPTQNWGTEDQSQIWVDAQSKGTLQITVKNAETGFAETYTPTTDEIKAYFNGWKVKTADPTTSKPTAWVNIVDGRDAPTQTLAYVAANKAPGYTPYKLSYVLAAPVVTKADVEGAISVNGHTQVEVGSGVIVREKANPQSLTVSGQKYHYININDVANNVINPLKYKVERIIRVYDENSEDKQWEIYSPTTSFGKQSARIPDSLFDSTKTYYVSYIIFDRHLLTNNAVNVLAQYANNIRTALEDSVKKGEDNSREITVHATILYDILKRLKAGGL